MAAAYGHLPESSGRVVPTLDADWLKFKVSARKLRAQPRQRQEGVCVWPNIVAHKSWPCLFTAVLFYAAKAAVVSLLGT